MREGCTAALTADRKLDYLGKERGRRSTGCNRVGPAELRRGYKHLRNGCLGSELDTSRSCEKTRATGSTDRKETGTGTRRDGGGYALRREKEVSRKMTKERNHLRRGPTRFSRGKEIKTLEEKKNMISQERGRRGAAYDLHLTQSEDAAKVWGLAYLA